MLGDFDDTDIYGSSAFLRKHNHHLKGSLEVSTKLQASTAVSKKLATTTRDRRKQRKDTSIRSGRKYRKDTPVDVKSYANPVLVETFEEDSVRGHVGSAGGFEKEQRIDDAFEKEEAAFVGASKKGVVK